MINNTINDATWSLTKSFQEANQAITDNAVAIQEQNVHLAQSIFVKGIEVLKKNTLSTRTLTRELVEQTEKQQAALQALAHEAVDAYVEFLYAPLSYYKEAVEFAETAAK